MEIKKYKLSKTRDKIAKENNLLPTYYGTDAYLDLSLLDEIKELDADELAAIKEDMSRYHIFHDREAMFIVLYNNYKNFEIRARFVRHNIYSAKTCKRIIAICELTKVKITRMQRKSIYDKKYDDVEELTAENYHGEPCDIEI